MAEERAANEAKIAKVRAATEAKIAKSEAARELKMADEDNAKIALETAITKEAIAVKEDEKLITISDQSVRKAIEARLSQAKEAREAAEVKAVDTRAIRVAEEISLRAAKAALVSNKSVSEKIQDQLLEFSEVVDDLMEKKEGEGLVVWSIVANWRKDGDIRYEPRNPIERKSMIWALEEFNRWQERKVEKDQIE